MKKHTILIVEDEEALRSPLAESFLADGFNVLTAETGEIGLKTALQEHPDLIILDIILPAMSGLDVLKTLREDTWGKTAHVMMLTNVNDTDKIAEAMNDNAFEYLIKTDIKLQDLVKKVRNRLEA
jgi:DNA-binding response OmpR family regulator